MSQNFFCDRSRGSATNREFGPTESVDSFSALEQRVEGVCAIVHGAPRERIEREEFGRAIERKEREIRAEREREKREKDAREKWEASRWPQEQEAIPGPHCTCSNEPSQEVSYFRAIWYVLRADLKRCSVNNTCFARQFQVFQGIVTVRPVGKNTICKLNGFISKQNNPLAIYHLITNLCEWNSC